MTRLTYTVTEASELLGVSRGLIYDQIRDGELKAIKLGRKIIITRATVEELLGHPIEVEAP